MEIQVDDMRAAGKTGYVAKIVNGEKVFLNAKSQNRYGSSRVTKTYQISEDGIYEICDANFGGRKRNIYFVKVESGEAVVESSNLNELISNELNLPELEGSQKQVSWAIAIRDKYIAKLKNAGKEVPEALYKQTSAKHYIDNRSQMQ